ncbi:MAG: YlbF family regulator [Mogibacterium sp.]|nr:YlbF family regulator [Mogibacterium sp.]
MNVYEEAHNLARAIKESNEFKDFEQKQLAAQDDPDTLSMIREMQSIQLQAQSLQIAGQQPDAEMMQRIQSLYTMVMTKPKAAEYLQAEARFSIMIKDVFEILSDVINIKF